MKAKQSQIKPEKVGMKKNHHKIKFSEHDDFMTLKVLFIDSESRVITEGNNDFEYGILLPQNVYYDGSVMAINYAKKHIAQNVKNLLYCRPIEIINKCGKKICFLQTQINHYEEDSKHKEYKENEIYPAKICKSYNSFYLISVDDYFKGYLPKDKLNLEIHIGDIINLRLKRRSLSSMQLSLFSLPEMISSTYEYLSEEEIDSKFESLFNEIERKALPEIDINLIKHDISLYPHISRTNTFLDDIEFLYCEYSLNQKKHVETFLKHRNHYLESASFWIRYDVQEQELILFNSDAIIITMVVTNGKFILKDLFDGRNNYTAVEILKKQKDTSLKFKGSKIKLIEEYHLVPDWYSPSSVLDYVSSMHDFYNRILDQLWHNIKELKKEHSKDFDNLSDILQYEIDMEERKVGDTLIITTDNKIERSSCKYYPKGLAFTFNLSFSDYNRLSNSSNEDVMYVAIVNNEGKILKSGVLQFDDQNEIATIEFPNNRDINASMMKSGFLLKRKTSSEHLKIQRNAIQSFIKDKERSLFAKYLTDDLPSPKIDKYKNIEFYNSCIAAASSGNNQPIAVKKALGNQSMLLIQGPPGTGKTTVIIEIIRQLVKEGKKVLVCAQAHAAVDNICNKIKKLKDESDIQYLSIGNEGENRDWANDFSSSDYKLFLENNKSLISSLNGSFDKKEDVLTLINQFNYESGSLKYKHYHKYIADYFERSIDLYDGADITLDNLIKNADKFSSELLEICQYDSMDVILGTCVGIGMNRVLRKKSICFDTVIIDEAAKANLAETLVPLQLGERYILVGDDRQLPPYLDRNLIEGYVKSNSLKNKENEKEEIKQYCQSLSLSLFEKFNHKINEECQVMLNFQYRMHPDIGSMISNVFYDGKVDMGKTTSEQIVRLKEPFDDQLLFIDTSSQFKEHGYNPYEIEEQGSYSNPCESNIISSYVIPSLEESGVIEQYSIGIITPYRAQRKLLGQEIQNKILKKCVYTIDSIQGSEFDIVIFSFVRSFPKNSHKTVGFLDDMRRLNVSLSRAKKKLILVGNLSTLTNPDAHKDFYSIVDLKPETVFKGLSTRRIQYLEKDMYQLFLDKYCIGDEIEVMVTNIEKNIVSFTFANDTQQHHKISLSSFYTCQLQIGTNIVVKYQSMDERRKPIFELVSFKSISGKEIIPLSESDIRMLYSEGDVITVLLTKIDDNGNIYIKYHNLSGKIEPNSITSDYHSTIKPFEFIDVHIKSFNEPKIIVLPTVVSQTHSFAELIDSNEIKTFCAKIGSINYNKTKLFEFEDGSSSNYQIANWYWLDFISKDSFKNIFFKHKNLIFYLCEYEYRSFMNKHIEGKIYNGIIKSRREFGYVVIVDGFCGFIKSKEHFEKGNELKLFLDEADEKRKEIYFRVV